MKLKLILTGLLATVYVQGFDSNEYKKLTEISPEISNKVETRINNLKDLYKNTLTEEELNKYKDLEKNTLNSDLLDIDTQLINSLDLYQGDEYMTKEEYKTISNKVLEARKTIKENLVSEFILFLTSETVPHQTHMNILQEVGILQENGVKIQTKQYLIGAPDDFQKYMFDKKDYMENLTPKEKKYILKNFVIKLDPRLFKEFDIKKAPAIVYGICSGKNPVKENCNFKYLIRGDTSLTNFFDKISEIEPKYKKYHEYLIGNKIIHD